MARLPHNVSRVADRGSYRYVAYSKDGFAIRLHRCGRDWEAYDFRQGTDGSKGKYIGRRKTLALIGALVASYDVSVRAPIVPDYRVIFRKELAGDIIAFFPDELDKGFLTCYAHVGQHSRASREYYQRMTKPASAEEYASLYKELRGIYETGEDAVRLVPIEGL